MTAAVDRQRELEKVRESSDIVSVIGNYVCLRKRGASGNYKGLCPFHKENTPSLSVSAVRQIFKCFGCGIGGDVFTFIELIEKVNFRRAKELLASNAGVAL